MRQNVLSVFIIGIFAFISISGISQDLPSDFLTPEFHKSRRDSLRRLMPPNSVVALFANPVRNRANDVDYIYHQDHTHKRQIFQGAKINIRPRI